MHKINYKFTKRTIDKRVYGEKNMVFTAVSARIYFSFYCCYLALVLLVETWQEAVLLAVPTS
jgi:hypothetical protein